MAAADGWPRAVKTHIGTTLRAWPSVNRKRRGGPCTAAEWLSILAEPRASSERSVQNEDRSHDSRKSVSTVPLFLFKMPIPAGANMGGPSTVDKCTFGDFSKLREMLIRNVVKMGAMMGGSTLKLDLCYPVQVY